jgi:Zn-finger nucleic acid-binding protein
MANLAVLRQYLRSDVVRSFWRKAISASATADKKCPSCRQSLRAFTIQRNGQTINLDTCRHCQLVWFDKGELDVFPKTKIEQLPPEVKHQLALMKVQFETEQQVQLEETAERIFAIFATPFFLPWYITWILTIYGQLIDFIVQRKGWRWAIPVIICSIVICIVIWLGVVPRDVAYPENPLSLEYRRNMNYLLDAGMQSPPDLSKIIGSLGGSYIPIVSEQDFSWFTKKLRYELHKGAGDDLLFHIIVVGGMDVRDIDQPLVRASKGLVMSGRRNIEIVIVAPSTISDGTKRILEERGLTIRRIGSPLPERQR